MPEKKKELESALMQVMEPDSVKVVVTTVEHITTKLTERDIICSSSESSSSSSSTLLSSCSSVNLSTASTKALQSINKEEKWTSPTVQSVQTVTSATKQAETEQELQKQKQQREHFHNLREQRSLHGMSASKRDCELSTTGKCVKESSEFTLPSSLEQRANNINAWCNEKMHELAECDMKFKEVSEEQHRNDTNLADKRNSEEKNEKVIGCEDSNNCCSVSKDRNTCNCGSPVREKEKLLQTLQMYENKIRDLKEYIRLLEQGKNKQLKKLQEDLKNEITNRQSVEHSFDELLSLVNELRSTTSLQLPDNMNKKLENQFTSKKESISHKKEENKLEKNVNMNSFSQASIACKETTEHKALSEQASFTQPVKSSSATLSDVFWCKLREREERARSRVRKELIERYETTIHALQCDKEVLAKATKAAECRVEKILHQNIQLQEKLHQVKLNEERINTQLREKEMVVHALIAKVKILYRQIDDKESETVNEQNEAKLELTRKCEELENTVEWHKERLSKLEQSLLELEKEVAGKQVQLESCSHELQLAINENADLRQELTSMKELKLKVLHTQLQEKEHMQEVQLATLKTTLESKAALIATLQQEIEELRANSEVREKEMSATLQERHCALQNEMLHERQQMEHELRDTQLVNRSLTIQLENLQSALYEANMFKSKTQTHHVNSEMYSREVLLASLQSEIAVLQKAWSESRHECAAERQCKMTEVLQLSETITQLKEENSFLTQLVAECDGQVRRLGWHESNTPIRAIVDKADKAQREAITKKTLEIYSQKEGNRQWEIRSKQKHYSWPSLSSLPSSTNTQPTVLCSQLSLEEEEEEESEEQQKRGEERKQAERWHKEHLSKSLSSPLHENDTVNLAENTTMKPLCLPRSSRASLQSSLSSTFSSTRPKRECNQQSARCLFAPTPSPLRRKSWSRSNTPTPSTVMNVLNEHHIISSTDKSNNKNDHHEYKKNNDEMRCVNNSNNTEQKSYTDWSNTCSCPHATQKEEQEENAPSSIAVNRNYVFCPQPLLPRPRKSVMFSDNTQCNSFHIHDNSLNEHSTNNTPTKHNACCDDTTKIIHWIANNNNSELVTTPRETTTTNSI